MKRMLTFMITTVWGLEFQNANKYKHNFCFQKGIICHIAPLKALVYTNSPTQHSNKFHLAGSKLQNPFIYILCHYHTISHRLIIFLTNSPLLGTNFHRQKLSASKVTQVTKVLKDGLQLQFQSQNQGFLKCLWPQSNHNCQQFSSISRNTTKQWP